MEETPRVDGDSRAHDAHRQGAFCVTQFRKVRCANAFVADEGKRWFLAAAAGWIPGAAALLCAVIFAVAYWATDWAWDPDGESNVVVGAIVGGTGMFLFFFFAVRCAIQCRDVAFASGLEFPWRPADARDASFSLWRAALTSLAFAGSAFAAAFCALYGWSYAWAALGVVVLIAWAFELRRSITATLRRLRSLERTVEWQTSVWGEIKEEARCAEMASLGQQEADALRRRDVAKGMDDAQAILRCNQELQQIFEARRALEGISGDTL